MADIKAETPASEPSDPSIFGIFKKGLTSFVDSEIRINEVNKTINRPDKFSIIDNESGKPVYVNNAGIDPAYQAKLGMDFWLPVAGIGALLFFLLVRR